MLPSPITYAAGNALLHSYHSTMESLRWQDIINLIMIEEEQEGTARYHPSARDRTVHPETKSTVREERKDSDPHTQRNGENHKARIDQKQRIDKPLRLRVMNGHSSDHDMEVPGGIENIAYGKTEKRKTDTDVPGPLKKLKTSGYKSVRSSNTSKDPEENSDPKLDVLRRGYPELLPNTEEEPKAVCQKDYVYVRARRGQASDSHSLAERARREKIKGRMKILQDLVPGCNKITSKALVLEEIINHVQSLQNQVQTLSMTLASVPLADFGFQTNGYQSTEIQQWQNMTLIEDIHRQ